ncbi:uncharacterized protein PV07_07513 [Cladophialophora immunda]|uniref:Heterokaryon incompatibility domain-containing protein n=1 Tax=Cladophialophora immunda TaxID=569365 RepID=A0A0D2C9N6_9EURO|nr:uncharacterized protein PV07_07513 [Cladophialophora immunda]KIW27808.1 hypothetical protein PV07_07513 [Cladophialophora immunda]
MNPLPELDYVIDGQHNDGQTPLSRAAEAGDENVVDTLLADKVVDINIRDHKGRTPLLLAAEGGHSKVVAQLLGRGANPNLEDLSGSTPLWEATNNGHTTVVRQLIDCDRMFNWNAIKATYRISHGSTALSIALDGLHHNADLTKRLHEVAVMLSQVDGVDPFVPHERGNALELAAQYKNEDAALILLDKFGTGQQGGDLLVTAVKSGSTRLVEALLTDHGVDPNDPGKYGYRPLTMAIQSDQAATARLLLAHERIQPCMDDILTYINFHQTSELVRLLVADGRFNMHYVNDQGQTLLSTAVEYGQTAYVEELLRDDKIDPDCPDNEGRTPLSHAANGPWNATTARQLLSTGRVDPNSVDKNGMTPLCHATLNGQHDVVEVILEHPDTDPNGNGKHVPLILAFDYFEEETINLLLAHPRIDPNRVDARGQTALAAAVRGSHTDMVERLLAVPGANPGHQDAAGVTLYHEAARIKSHPLEGYKEAAHIMKLLLGATNRGDPDMEDAKGRTPLSVAAEYGNAHVVNMLLAVDGVRADTKDATGRRPLSWAIASKVGGSDIINMRLDAVRHLLSRKEVYPNARDADGMTPLMHAVLRHGCSGSMVQLLIARDDLDVHQTDRNGCMAMTVAKAYGDTMSMTLLRSRGAIDDGKTAFGVLVGKEATEDTNVTRKSRDVYNMDHHRFMDWDDYRHGKDSLLPLGKQDAYGDVDDGDADLCPRCATLDLDSLFSQAGSSVDLGRVDASWESRRCGMCRLIAVARPGHRDGRTDDDSLSCVLKAFGTTWFGTPDSNWSENWIDTKVLAVLHQEDSEHYADSGFDQDIPYWNESRPHIFEATTIGRLGSNCPYGSQALTISPQAARPFVDLDLAKNWIAHCRKHHTSEPCTRHQLHAIPHFRLVECTTGKIMTLGQGGEASPSSVPPYVALSYVWGQGNQGDQNVGTQQLVLDALPAVIHDAINTTLALGYDHLWVDQYCVVQQGDAAVKRVQLRAMDLVYANAEVTLVAAAGKDVTAGLPGVPGRPRTGWPCVRVHGHALTVIPPHPAHHVRSSSTWWTRGWTYQEGLMARRRLFFSDCEMSFECGMDYTRREAVHQPLHTNYDSSTHLQPRMFRPGWRLFYILQEYTARRLTCSADALNAMLGIFRAYAQRKEGGLHHLCGVPVVPVGEKADGSDSDSDGYGDLGVKCVAAGARKDGKDDHESDPSRWDSHPLDTVSIATIIVMRDHEAWDLWKDVQQAANRRVGTLTGLVHGLFWRLKKQACRRPEFPSWSWTGWTGTVQPRRDRHSHDSRRLERIWIVPDDVSISVVIPAQAQSGTAAVTVSWTDFYDGLVAGTDEKYLLQHYVLAITAPEVSIRIRERITTHDYTYYPNPFAFIGTVAFGNSIWEGGFFPTREDAYPPENEPDITPGFRKRLLSQPWLGLMLRLAPRQDQRMESTVLVVEEVQPTDQAERRWERIGVLMLCCTLAGHTLERRTIYLS